MFNIAVTKPEVIVYENLHFAEALKEECMNFLTNNGYLCKSYGPNTLAMRSPAANFERFFRSDQKI